MNALIAQLANQAKTSVPAGLLVNEWIDEYNQIFAELIIRECINICENQDFPENPDLFQHGWDGGLQNAQERMMNHFGVES